MADKRKIVIEVDSSQFKKYTEEEKRATTKANEEQKRQTAQLKVELNERYANLKAVLQKELIARQQNKELVVKEAIRERKILETELKNFSATHRTELAERLSQTRASLDKEVALYKAQIKQISSAPRTNLKGNIGSESYVRQLQSSRSGMLPSSPEFAQTTALINRYKATLKESGVEVKSLAQNIRGELSQALTGQASVLIGTVGAWKLFNLSLESARFKVLRANFEGTTEDIETFRKATSGTVDDASLLKLSNQATDLGISLKDQAILFSLAEDSADKYGTTVEEGFQKVVFATEGNVKGLKSIGIQKAVYEEIVKRLSLAHGKEIDQLDAETQKQIRLQAILEASGQTYDSVTNKVQDSADQHEQFLVIAKNLALEFGGDLFNAVTGVGTAYKILMNEIDKGKKIWNESTEAVKKEIIAVQDILDKWGLLSKVAQTPIRLTVEVDAPNLDNVWAQIQGLRQGTLTDQLNTASFITGKSTEEIMKIARDKGWLGFAKENEANSPSKSSSNKSGSTGTQVQKEELNLLKLAEAELEKLNIKLDANLDSEIARLEVLKQIAEVEAKILFYKGEQAFRGIQTGFQDLPQGARFLRNNRVGLGVGGNINPRQQQIEDMEREENLNNAMLAGFEGMNNFVISMLEKTGLMDSDFGRIVAMIQSIIGVGKEAFSVAGLIGDIIGFLPGGSVISGGISGGGGLIHAIAGGMSSHAPVVVQNHFHGELSAIGTYRVVKSGNNMIAERGDGVI